MLVRIGYVTAGAALLVGLTGTAVQNQQGPSVPVAQEFDRLHFRSIGPATMSGRISDLAVYEANPAVYYVGTAHGGVWKTTSNGTMFTPLFQDEGLISIGDVEISQTNPDLVWVGGGESNNRQSTSWGGGVYKSTDGGQTWQHMGLPNARHIHDIVIDPVNNDIVLVAATGPLFGPGGDRGIYKTTDGGRTWRQVLAVDEETGGNDLIMSPTNPRILYASTYQRRRTACCMNGGGPGSGIWKSTDGGDTWTRLTGGGLPSGPLGRIALASYRRDGNIVYALIEGPSQGRGGGGGGGGRGGAQDEGATGLYRSNDGGQSWEKLSSGNPRPMYFSKLRIDPNNAERIYMGGVGLWMSIDGGRTFHPDAAMALHDDVHAIWINPSNSDHILIGNDGGLGVTYDMSKTWVFLPNLPVGLFYHVSYDMEIPFNICGGMQDNYNWCGPSRTRHNRGIFTHDWFQIQGGDGFHAIPDLRDSRIIYTESQNGNMIRRNKVTGESKSIRPTLANVVNATPGETYRFHWDSPMMLSPHDPGVLMVAANRVFRSTDKGDSWTAISPDLTTGANRDTIRTMGVVNTEVNIARNDGISWWPTIYSLAESPRQAGVIWTGTDDGVVSVTRDGGRNWTNVTRDIPGMPALGLVTEVVPSRFDAATAYVTVDNHWHNDYETYMWVTTDYGQTFRSIAGNLRGENVRTLTEDTKNPDVLYIGTETGLFVTLDRGRTWRRIKANLPTVRVDEITIHPRDNAMIVGTHGRVLFVLDDLSPIQEYAAVQAASGDARLFTPAPALQWKSMDNRNDEFWGHQWFVGENPPTDAVIAYHLERPVTDLKLRISEGSRVIRELAVPASRNQAGIQFVCWDQRVAPIEPPATGGPPAGRGGGGGGRGGRGGANIPGVPTGLPEPGYKPADPCDTGGGGGGGRGGFGGFGGGGNAGPHVVPGTYTVSLVSGTAVLDSKPLRIVGDPAVQLTDAERRRYNQMVEELHELQRRATAVAGKLNTLHPQMQTAATRLAELGTVPADVRSQFEALNRDYEAVRVKFGVPMAAGGGGRGGFGRGGGAFDPANVLGRTGAVKNSMMSFWEMPSDALVRQYNQLRGDVPRAINEANGILTRAGTLAPALQQAGITLNAPPPER